MSLSVNSNTTDNIILGQASMEQQDWLKATEVAKLLGTTDRTVQRLVERGQLVAYKIGRTLKFKPSDLEKYLERVKIDNTQQAT
jgi:excisionase family DNA binding protein